MSEGDFSGNQELPDAHPTYLGQKSASLEELSQLTGRAKSNLSRTLKTMAGYGLVRMEKGQGLKLVPKVAHDRVELVLPLTGGKAPRKAAGGQR